MDVKVNAREILAREVREHPPGTVRMSPILTDPYQPIEKRYRITRQCVEVLIEAEFRPVILTRESRVLDDLDLLTRGRSAVGFSIPTDDDGLRLDELQRQRSDAFAAGKALDPLVAGPEHALLAKRVASDLRALVQAASDLEELVGSWQYLAGMCGLLDELEESERPDADWRSRIEQALAFIEEATA